MMMPVVDSHSATVEQEKLTTRVIKRNESKMSRTAGVRERLAPIMERMMSSLAQIQTLEESLVAGEASAGSDSTQYCDADDGIVDRLVTPLCQSNGLKFRPGSNKSRKILKNRMETLKKKLTSLQMMEDTLNMAEDRRQNLQHYFLQASLSKPMLELASANRRNQELEHHLDIAKHEQGKLEERCSTVDYLEERILELLDSLKKLNNVEAELLRAEERNNVYEKDLQQRQAKIDKLSMRCEGLECEVDQLKCLCENRRQNNLHEEEQKQSIDTVNSESNSYETFVPTELISNHHVRSKQSVSSLPTAPTETDADSLSIQSSVAAESASTSPREVCGEDESQVLLDTSLDSLTEEDDLINMLRVVDTSRLSQFEDDDISSLLPEGQGIVMVQKLVAKLEKMDKENAELRTQHRVSNSKLTDLVDENSRQASRLRALEQKQRATQCEPPQEPPNKVTRGSFFAFLKNESSYLKRNSKA